MGSKSKKFNMKSTATYLFGKKTKKSKERKTLPDIISKSIIKTFYYYLYIECFDATKNCRKPKHFVRWKIRFVYLQLSVAK